MVVVWWPLDVQKECGLGSGMIRGVCAPSAFHYASPSPSEFVHFLNLRMVSQCAMLEDFGIFIVLADKVRG